MAGRDENVSTRRTKPWPPFGILVDEPGPPVDFSAEPVERFYCWITDDDDRLTVECERVRYRGDPQVYVRTPSSAGWRIEVVNPSQTRRRA